MKTTVAFLTITAVIVSTNCFGQGNTWKLDANNNVGINSKIGSGNNADFKMVTRDSVRQTITKEGDVIIEKKLTVKGPLVIGVNTFSIMDNVPVFPGPILVDQIRSDNGRIALMQGDISSFSSNIKLGIGTQIPVFSLTLAGDGINTNGGILSSGTFDTTSLTIPRIPAGLTGPRFIWYPAKAAIRAGEASNLEWEEDSIGIHSVAFGLNTKATAAFAFAMGNASVASGITSFAMGDSAFALGRHSMAFGHGSRAITDHDIAIGPGAVANSIGLLGLAV